MGPLLEYFHPAFAAIELILRSFVEIGVELCEGFEAVEIEKHGPIGFAACRTSQRQRDFPICCGVLRKVVVDT